MEPYITFVRAYHTFCAFPPAVVHIYLGTAMTGFLPCSSTASHVSSLAVRLVTCRIFRQLIVQTSVKMLEGVLPFAALLGGICPTPYVLMACNIHPGLTSSPGSLLLYQR